jgi:hypothetical protein
MALIKSALELALENTADIVGDKESIRHRELEERGKRIASRFLFDLEEKNEELASALKEQKKEEKKEVTDAVVSVFLSNITLPREEVATAMLDRIKEGLLVITGEKKKIPAVIDQLSQFFLQFIENRDQIIEHLKKQFQPQLDAKSKALSRQYGRQVNLTPEQDPEFMEHLNHNLGKLEEQYQNALDQAKKDLAAMV